LRRFDAPNAACGETATIASFPAWRANLVVPRNYRREA
jgi:hypothetical protein